MKAIMVMFDSLNRRMLPPYGCSWVKAPNFERLARRTAVFDTSYVCSMPCMPARRDLHTGRPNFLHRSWGPLEPFDASMPRMLHEAGVYTHLVTDHYHYWEDGGSNYMSRYSSHAMFRGQEGDLWKGQVRDPETPDAAGQWRRSDRVNRQFMAREEEQPQAKTFAAGLDFIERNRGDDNWMLQIETFDPHEPYFTSRQYKDLYPEHYRNYRGREFDWPAYGRVSQTPEEVAHARHESAALHSMCDRHLGDVLDMMDRHKMWDDTMLVVWTDHGFLLGEHGCWAKSWLPYYEEVARTPFFVWDPRARVGGERRRSIVQPALDLAPTLLRYFGRQPGPHMLGKDLAPVVAKDAPVREAALFGHFGAHVNVADGRWVYMRGSARPDNQPLFNYTLAPFDMRAAMGLDCFQEGCMAVAPPFSFTQGAQTMRLPGGSWFKHDLDAEGRIPTMLFDLESDPGQERPVADAAAERRMTEHLVRLMRACDAPSEQYERLGLKV